MTKAREWPNNAREARDEAAQDLQEIIKCLSYYIKELHQLTADERLALVSRSLHHAHNAIRWLEKVGAPTQPFIE